MIVSPALAAPAPVRRADGFLLIWQSILRPAQTVKKNLVPDVPSDMPGFKEINYAASRGLLDDAFSPANPLTLETALLWIFRTRNVEALNEDGTVEYMELPDPEHVPRLAAKYDINFENPEAPVTREQLLELMRKIDEKLRTEPNETSLYSEKFHGKGTAFGETFDMNAMTAAHRSFPYNTMVKVTNVANGKSVTVRINDRGPFVQGRHMDLSLAAFTAISPRSAGKIMATYERLGDVTMVSGCKESRYQRRVGRTVVLRPGIPHTFPLGEKLHLDAEEFFVMRAVRYPDGNRVELQEWIGPDEEYVFNPSLAGVYTFEIGAKNGRVARMRTEVVDCSQNG